jgi:rod shape-determining protein MreB
MPAGNMVVDMGGGTAEAAVIAVNGIVVSDSVRVGGNRIDEAIISYVRKKYNLVIGDQTAEQIKIEIGSALPLEEELRTTVQGRDHVTGLPRTIEVDSGEVTEALSEPLAAIVGMVKNVLSRTPPELASDIIDRGMVMTGGSALLRNTDQLLTAETQVPCYVADDPVACVAIGAGRALERFEVIKKSLPPMYM